MRWEVFCLKISQSDTSLSHLRNDSISLLSQANLKLGKVIWAVGRIGRVWDSVLFFYDDSPFISILVSFGFNPRPFLLTKLIFIEMKLTICFDSFCSLPPYALCFWGLGSLALPFFWALFFPLRSNLPICQAPGHAVSSQRE